MYKLLAAAVYLTLSAQAALGSLGAGQTCVTIAGPTKEKCARGLNCCFVANDYSVCHRGDCPSQYIPEGGLCDGFAGPVPGECWPGTTCCNLNPDNSVCLSSCK